VARQAVQCVRSAGLRFTRVVNIPDLTPTLLGSVLVQRTEEPENQVTKERVNHIQHPALLMVADEAACRRLAAVRSSWGPRRSSVAQPYGVSEFGVNST
jgi:hypothetical protein